MDATEEQRFAQRSEIHQKHCAFAQTLGLKTHVAELLVARMNAWFFDGETPATGDEQIIYALLQAYRSESGV